MTHKDHRVPTAPTASTAFAVPAAELPKAPSDTLIDRALHSLRDTHPPTGLEARVAARLTQAAEARIATRSSIATTSSSASFFALILTLSLPKGKAPRIPLTPAPLYTVAATALLTITLITISHHHKPQTMATINTNSDPALRAGGPPYTSVGRSPTYTPTTTTRGPEARSIAPPTLTQPTDPDTLALAETLAPSHPAPPMPLTAQEHLLLLATRQGQPMELAELETLRQPALQAAAEAHQNAIIRRYAQSLLGPLAAAEALNPTSPSPDDTSTPQQPSSK
jgi:hypothetical protein